MPSGPRIALSVPQTEKSGKYFSLRLKHNNINQPATYDKVDTIVAVSDIEGNFMRLVQHLLVNKVIDKSFRWIFGEGHLVILGDCFDRGEQVVECLWLIYSLEEKARKFGGYVHFLLGNHEIMNMNGDWRYVHPKYATTINSDYNVLYNGNSEIWRWLQTKNVIEKIGDILFVHGGISRKLLDLNTPIEEINGRIRPYYSNAMQDFSDSLLNIVFNTNESPVWYRGYYSPESPDKQVLLDDTLKYFEVNTIITGHTVMDHITRFYDGKLINIDTDHASTFSESLCIAKGKFYGVKNNGKKYALNI